jgi:hypothetical protein
MNAGCRIPAGICGHTANSRCLRCEPLKSNTFGLRAFACRRLFRLKSGPWSG